MCPQALAGGDSPQVPVLKAFSRPIGYHLRADAAGRRALGVMDRQKPNVPREPPAGLSISTVVLLRRAQEGDEAARNALIERCLPRLRQWAKGRLPAPARGLVETDDLVQEALLKALDRLPALDARHGGGLHAYLRQVLVNRLRDEGRRALRRPPHEELASEPPAAGASPLEQAIGRETLERYEEGLSRLRPEEREAVIGRIELQYSYEELALALDKPSPDAARMAVARALQRLAQEMRHGT